MAKNSSSRRGGGVVIRRTQGRPGGTNTSLGKAVGVRAIGSPTSSTGKHGIDKKTTVAPRKTAS
jgi:hypothetical protein